MSRFVFGPAIGPVALVAAVPPGQPPAVPPVEVPPPVVKSDIAVAFGGFTPEGLFHFDLPPYDVVLHNLLLAVHVVLVADGAPVPTDPTLAVADASLLKYTGDARCFRDSGRMTLDATVSPPAAYTALAVLEFDA